MTALLRFAQTLVRRFKEFFAKHPFVTAELVYLLLVCIAFPSMTMNFSSAIPGIQGRQGDYSIFYWNIWWFQHSVFHLGQDPFYTNFILYPHTLNLAYHMFTPFLDVAVLPAYALFGSVVGINSLIFGSIVFSGLCMFAFLRHHSIPNGLSFVGGLLYAFNSFTTAHVSMSQLDMLPIGWLPLAFLGLDWLVERRYWLYAFVLSGVLYAAVMTDFQFGIWLAMALGPYAIYRLLRADRSLRPRIFALGMLSAIVLFGLMSIAPLPQLMAGRTIPYPPVSFEAAEVEGYINPIDLVGVPARLIESDGQVTLGILLPLLIGVGLIRGKRRPTAVMVMRSKDLTTIKTRWGVPSARWLWLIGGVGFIVLAMGPTLHPYEIPLPYRILHVALGGMYRAPARFMLPAIFSLVVFAAISLRADYRRLNRFARWIGIIGAVIVVAIENRWAEPFPTFTLPDYQIYHTIGAEPDEYLVLEVPVGPYNNITEEFGGGAQLEYYAAIHHKRLINGQVSRAPAGTTHDYRQWKLITALAGERAVPDLAAAQSEFQRLTQDWDIRYVIVHRDLISPDLANWAIGFFNTRSGWCLVDEEGPLFAYHRLDGKHCSQANLIDPPTDGAINIGDGNDDRYLGLGWYLSENVGGPQARWTGAQSTSDVRVHLQDQAYRITLHATSYVPNQVVRVTIDGTHITDVPIGDAGWGEYGFNLPSNVIPSDGLITFTFTSSRSQSAFDRTNGQVDDRRPLAVAYDWIKFTPAP